MQASLMFKYYLLHKQWQFVHLNINIIIGIFISTII